MEKDILKIINDKNIDSKKDKKKDVAIIFSDVEKLDKERKKTANYNSEVSKLVNIC